MELKIAEKVAEELGIEVEQLQNRSMKREIAHNRHFFWYVLYHATSMSLPVMGALFGYHHTTILHGIQEVKLDLVKRERAARIINEFYQAPIPAHMQLAVEFS